MSNGSSTRRRRAGGDRRRAVLTTVVDVLAKRGYHHTRFRDVSEASGVAISTLQSYFGSREDMLIEALEAATDGEVAAMEAAGERTDDLWERLVLLVNHGIDTPVPAWHMLLEFWAAAAHDDELRAHSITLQSRYRVPFENTLRTGIEQGVFTTRHDAAGVADVLVSALDGLCVPRALRQPRPSTGPFREVLLDQLAMILGVIR